MPANYYYQRLNDTSDEKAGALHPNHSVQSIWKLLPLDSLAHIRTYLTTEETADFRLVCRENYNVSFNGIEKGYALQLMKYKKDVSDKQRSILEIYSEKSWIIFADGVVSSLKGGCKYIFAVCTYNFLAAESGASGQPIFGVGMGVSGLSYFATKVLGRDIHKEAEEVKMEVVRVLASIKKKPHSVSPFTLFYPKAQESLTDDVIIEIEDIELIANRFK